MQKIKVALLLLMSTALFGSLRSQRVVQTPVGDMFQGVVQIETHATGSGKGELTPAVDAMVCLCAVMSHDAAEPEYKALAMTVADATGEFRFFERLDPAQTYAIRARAPGFRWTTREVRSGAQSVKGATPFSIVLDRAEELTSLGAGQYGPAKFGSMEVLFATDRLVDRAASGIRITNVNSADGTLTMGACQVAVERNRKDDGLLQYFADRDSDRYYSVQSVRELSPADLWASFNERLERTNHDALLFIHGYNSSFDDACRRAAQVAYDLKFAGPVFLYSWPSHASLLRYAADEEMAEWSGPHFNSFLRQLLQGPKLQHLHVVAHSMGNRLALRGLFSLSAAEQEHLGQVVFAAPDVNRLIFNQGEFQNLHTKRVTLYASDHDQALAASKVFHGYMRAGDAKPDIDVRPGLDSIDASAVDTSLLGHNYIGEARSVLADLAALLSTDTAPDRRSGLLKESAGAKTWWVLSP